MAALKIGFTMNEWCGFSVPPYALRKDADSSSDTEARFCVSAMAVKSRPLEETWRVSSCWGSWWLTGREWEEGKDGPDKPDQSFSRGVLLCLEFVDDKVLDGRRLERGSELSVPDFLKDGQRVDESSQTRRCAP